MNGQKLYSWSNKMPQTYADEAIIIEAELSALAEKVAIDIELFSLRMTASGVGEDVVISTLLTDLNSSGAIFGSFKNGLKNTTKEAVNSIKNLSAKKEYIKAGINLMKWITVSAKPCPDCMDRAGEVGTPEYFKAIGEPQSGFSVCGRHCKCVIVPESYSGDTTILR